MYFGKKLLHFHQQGSWCARSWEYSQWAQHLLHLSQTLSELDRLICTQKQNRGKLGAGDLPCFQFLKAHAVGRLESWCFSFAVLFPTSVKLYSTVEGEISLFLLHHFSFAPIIFWYIKSKLYHFVLLVWLVFYYFYCENYIFISTCSALMYFTLFPSASLSLVTV